MVDVSVLMTDWCDVALVSGAVSRMERQAERWEAVWTVLQSDQGRRVQ